MTESTVRNGWVALPCGCDVELRHGIPVMLSCASGTPGISAAELTGEVAALTGLDISVAEWLPGEAAGEMQARAHVAAEQFTEVLHQLALSSAAVFFDRYHKAVDTDDVDWDTLEYANDFRRALDHCALEWNTVDRESCKAAYLESMHSETRRLAGMAGTPLTEPETD